jgi:tRNA pseudouridine55 synthase
LTPKKEIDAVPAEVQPDPSERRRSTQRRSTRVEVNGWINLDKPVGVTSTQAVAQLKHLFNAKKAGHAGTLDPLASGVLPVALGEATKTVPIVQEGAKAYRFVVTWGEETDTDDAEGRIVASSPRRPTREEIEAALPRFVGLISQIPPTFSAIRVAGERAYDLARGGEAFEIAARPIFIHRLELVETGPNEASFEAECGKGAYVRAIARDLGRELGCRGHIAALRRTRVGPFSASGAAALDALRQSPDARAAALLAVEAGLAELACIAVDQRGAAILRRGQELLLRGVGSPQGPAYAARLGAPVALGKVEGGYFVATRVFNLPD